MRFEAVAQRIGVLGSIISVALTWADAPSLAAQQLSTRGESFLAQPYTQLDRALDRLDLDAREYVERRDDVGRTAEGITRQRLYVSFGGAGYNTEGEPILLYNVDGVLSADDPHEDCTAILRRFQRFVLGPDRTDANGEVIRERLMVERFGPATVEENRPVAMAAAKALLGRLRIEVRFIEAETMDGMVCYREGAAGEMQFETF